MFVLKYINMTKCKIFRLKEIAHSGYGVQL